MSHFDQRLRDSGIHTFSRYVDDFKFSYISEGEKEAFLLEFNKICIELGLFINEQKTYTDAYPDTQIRDKSFINKSLPKYHSLRIDKTMRSLINSLIDKCIIAENSGNKGAIKYLFVSLLEQTIEMTYSPRNLERILFENEESRVSIFDRIIDLSLTNSQYTNRFIRLINGIIKFGVDKRTVYKYFNEFFTRNSVKIGFLIEKYIKNNYHQELYQILLYAYEFQVDINIEKYLESIITIDRDDFTLIISTLLYIRKYPNILPENHHLLKLVDNLFITNHELYEGVRKHTRMKERFWLYRYFFYCLIKSEYISPSVVKKYCRSAGYANSPYGGFKSELNYAHIFNLDKEDPVTKFYLTMLDFDIHLVNLINLGKISV